MAAVLSGCRERYSTKSVLHSEQAKHEGGGHSFHTGFIEVWCKNKAMITTYTFSISALNNDKHDLMHLLSMDPDAESDPGLRGVSADSDRSSTPIFDLY